MSYPTGVTFLLEKQRIINDHKDSFESSHLKEHSFTIRAGACYKGISQHKAAKKLVSHMNTRLSSDLADLVFILFRRKEQLLCQIEDSTTRFREVHISLENFDEVRKDAIENIDLASMLVNNIVEVQKDMDSMSWLPRDVQEQMDGADDGYDKRLMEADACLIELEEMKKAQGMEELRKETKKNKDRNNESKNTELERRFAILAGIEISSLKLEGLDPGTPGLDSDSGPDSGPGTPSDSNEDTPNIFDPAAAKKAFHDTKHQLRMHGRRYGCVASFINIPDSRDFANAESEKYIQLKELTVSVGTMSNHASAFLEMELVRLSGIPQLIYFYGKDDSPICRGRAVRRPWFKKGGSPLKKECTEDKTMSPEARGLLEIAKRKKEEGLRGLK